MIDKNKTFENYVVNENNSFAVYLAKEIVNSCADGSEGMNLYLYGKPGSGKTHLLQAIGNRCEKDHVVVSTTAELFMNDFVGHLRNQTMGKFREKYRTCDLQDDFEYIQGKEQTQEELYLTLAERIMQKRKFVIASRIPLNSIEIAYPNLETLLYGCIISELKAPADLNMESIIQNKCKELNLDLEKEKMSGLYGLE